MYTSFASIVHSRYVIISSLPGRDYPPANIAAWVKHCESLGRKDLAKQITAQWEKIYDTALEKYPVVRQNWGAAVKIGGASIKKNVFKGVDFAEWLATNQDLTPKQEESAKEAAALTGIPVGTPAIAIPADNETPEMWLKEADKTKQALENAEQAFTNVDELIAYLQKEVKDISGKIEKYSTAKNKDGSPSAYALRLPKWKEQLKLYDSKLEETLKRAEIAKRNLESGKLAYETAPVTTVAFEKSVQQRIMDLTTRLGDLDKERATVISELQKLVGQLGKVTASVTVTADLMDVLNGLIERIVRAWKSITNWGNDVLEASHSFLDLATLRSVA